MKKKLILDLNVLSIFILLIFLCGCHSNSQKQQVDVPPQPSKLRTISINPNVKLVAKPIYRSVSGATTAMLAGPIAGLAVKMATDDTGTLKTLAESKEVDLSNLVIGNFHEQLTKSDAPLVLVDKDAEAELTIEIDEYGLIPRISTLQPIVSIVARLIKPDGTEIWSGGESYGHPDVSGISTQTWADYKANPSLLKISFNEIIKKATTEVVKSLYEDHHNGEIEE